MGGRFTRSPPDKERRKSEITEDREEPNSVVVRVETGTERYKQGDTDTEEEKNVPVICDLKSR